MTSQVHPMCGCGELESEAVVHQGSEPCKCLCSWGLHGPSEACFRPIDHKPHCRHYTAPMDAEIARDILAAKEPTQPKSEPPIDHDVAKAFCEWGLGFPNALQSQAWESNFYSEIGNLARAYLDLNARWDMARKVLPKVQLLVERDALAAQLRERDRIDAENTLERAMEVKTHEKEESQMTDDIKSVCVWTEEDPWGSTPETWMGTCEILWYLNEGGPKEHEMNFCPKCGKPLQLVPWKDEPDEDDE